MQRMTKRERLAACLAGERVDRIPISLWRHWPLDDRHGESLARVSIHWQETFDFDFAKIMMGGDYLTAGWGAAMASYTGHPMGDYNWGPRPIHSPDDWYKLPVLDPYSGVLDDFRHGLQLLGRHFGTETPFIPTVFDPLTEAKKLAGPDFLEQLRANPDAVKAGLETITQTLEKWVDAIRDTGIAGIYYALQFARPERLSEAEYREYARPNDLRILEAADGLWLNLLHIHEKNILFDVVADYPVALLNWHDRDTPPSMAEGLRIMDKAGIGGLSQYTHMQNGTPESVRAEIQGVIRTTGTRRVMIGTGCATPITAPWGNVWAARQAVEEIKGQ